MKTIHLAIGIHNHQPNGNFESVFENAFTYAYEPFVQMMEKYPTVKVSLHYTGILLDWFSKNRPEFLKRVRQLVARGQVEIMGGAFYEAILPIIPDEDKLDQLEKLSQAIKKHFGEKPAGMWLAERVWEQHLTRFIAEAGLNYVVVDDTHFKHAGLSDNDLFGYYLTEEEGKSIKLFPVSKVLRYAIPFQDVERTIEFLGAIAREDGYALVTYADDGEKFGVWPKTYDHVYKSGWLDRFFKALVDNQDWIKTTHFKDAIRLLPPAGRTYLPNASYAEMMQWALPASKSREFEQLEKDLRQDGLGDRVAPFLKGGYWRNFLVKYPEANHLHKRMLRTSARARGSSKPQTRSARNDVWASQCNDPYWHGVFGGIYLPHLRYAAYTKLIEADKKLDRIERLKDMRVELTDFDCDGYDELIVESPVLSCYCKPHLGGAIFELDFKPISLNLLDIVSRREEGYHNKLPSAVPADSADVASIHDVILAKESGLQEHLHYDWYRHGTLIDHFFGIGTVLDDVWRCSYQGIGDFVDQPYDVKIKRVGKNLHAELQRNGALRYGDTRHRLSIQKTITFDPRLSQLVIDYAITNLESKAVDVWFGVEFNVGLQAGDAPDRYYYSDTSVADTRLRSKGEIAAARFVCLRDEWLNFDTQIKLESPATFWRFPIETISLSEGGFEKIYQSSVVLPHWKFRLEKEWKTRIVHSFAKAPKTKPH